MTDKRTPAQLKRDRRDRLACNASVLDHCPQHVGETLTQDEVLELFGVRYNPTLRMVLEHHGEELRADGWNGESKTFTRRAIMRIALIFRIKTSPMARRIAQAAEDYDRLIKFEASAEQVARAYDALDFATAIAEQVRDADPAEVWAELGDLDAYTLKAAVVTLAALVPLDVPVMGWLSSLAPANTIHRGAMGLALLLPTPDSADGVPPSVISDGLNGEAA